MTTSAAVTALSSPLAAAGLLGGFAAGQLTGRRGLAGALFAAAGAGSAYGWQRRAGTPAAAALTAGYVAAMGASHPLAKRIGAWPAAVSATAATVAASELVRRLHRAPAG